MRRNDFGTVGDDVDIRVEIDLATSVPATSSVAFESAVVHRRQRAEVLDAHVEVATSPSGRTLKLLDARRRGYALGGARWRGAVSRAPKAKCDDEADSFM